MSVKFPYFQSRDETPSQDKYCQRPSISWHNLSNKEVIILFVCQQELTYISQDTQAIIEYTRSESSKVFNRAV